MNNFDNKLSKIKTTFYSEVNISPDLDAGTSVIKINMSSERVLEI